MSWNGTVSCGYCCADGHNKRTCPNYTKMLERCVADESLTGYTKEYYVEELDKRGVGKAGAYRTCSFCEDKGHDRRNCKRLDGVVHSTACKIIKGREKFLENAKTIGFGVGSLVEFQRSGYVNGKWGDISTLATVQKIKWANITHHTLEGDRQVVDVTFWNGEKKRENFTCIHLPFEMMSFAEEPTEDHFARGVKILAPGAGPVTVPDDFLSIKAAKKIAKYWMVDQKAYNLGV